MIEVDGSLGEGGGQVLRTALTLSVMTGQPVHISRIRARRPKPGLQPQHLAAVRAAATVSGAAVEGAAIGSQELAFDPGPARPGDYRFDIGTAGSTSLVLQTIFLPLALTPGAMLSTREQCSGPRVSVESRICHAERVDDSKLDVATSQRSISSEHLPSSSHEDQTSLPIGDASLEYRCNELHLVHPLSMTGGRDSCSSEITVIGGTHVPWSPCFHYLDLQWLPYLRRMGCEATLELLLAGFYPQGNGQVRARITPTPELTPLHLTERGALRGIRGIAAVANLDVSIAERQRSRAIERLQGRHGRLDIELLELPARTRGAFLFLLAEFRHTSACFVGLGAPGKRAEQVADEACLWLEKFLAGTGAVDEYLADQLLLPLAFAAGESRFRTAHVTPHLVTNAEIIRASGAAEIEITKEHGREGNVRVTPRI